MSNGLYNKEEFINKRLEPKNKGRSLTQDAIRRFRKNKLAIFSFYCFLIFLAIAIFGPMLTYAEDEVFCVFLKEPHTTNGWHFF